MRSKIEDILNKLLTTDGVGKAAKARELITLLTITPSSFSGELINLLRNIASKDIAERK